MSSRALRWWHTLRHLRPVQVYGRIWFRLHRPAVDMRPAPAPRAAARSMAALVMKPPSLLRPWVFRFLNEERDLDTMAGWDDASVAKLWRYNLHYFDDLVAAGAENRRDWHRDWLLRWVRENPPASGSGWEPYPCSLRIVNWIRWAAAGNTMPAQCLQSLATQVRWLGSRLEHHLLGNHLWANAKALVFAGVFFEGPEPDRWRAAGLRLLQRELREQVLPDGGHFERSPMYHAVILADLLELLALDQALPGVLPPSAVSAWREALPRMLRWLRVLTHPDGDIALFNDAAFGIAPRGADLQAAAQSLGLMPDDGIEASPAIDLPDSGYVRLQCGPAVLLADVGLVGPDYIPGHAHADTLSFELSLHGQRLLVDTGTSRYDVSPERLRQRGTAAHNTLQIDGADSSEVWSSFRVARRARPFGKALAADAAAPSLACAHDGYRRLPGRPVHRRSWQLRSDGLRVVDQVEGSCRDAVARYLFHPHVVVEAGGGDTGRLRLPGGQAVRWQARGGVATLRDSTHHPEFNLSVPTQCLELRLNGRRGELELTWD
ncbi:alginate lyase family protein [Piscinibacter sp. XHJ-5]|uniref:heparinase II/III family protein n=1 Tax=Piscinibacter sp. XHJ-5 TaxID=3037797 RepID=UPI002452A994|nr:alginate lyase family protein [Piscinibacter sp. XHJ-5]